MSAFKEIVAKAVIGKGKKYFKNSYTIKTENTPTTVLGCWVINHKFKGYKTGEKIGVDGSYDINIWYSYDNDSKTTVVNKKIDYNDIFNVALLTIVSLITTLPLVGYVPLIFISNSLSPFTIFFPLSLNVNVCSGV